jgi:hypothetical protein
MFWGAVIAGLLAGALLVYHYFGGLVPPWSDRATGALVASVFIALVSIALTYARTRAAPRKSDVVSSVVDQAEWQPFSDPNRRALSRGFQLLGKHSITIASSGNLDCLKRAKEFTELFDKIEWQTKWVGPSAYSAAGAMGTRILGKSDSRLAHDVANVIITVLGGTVDSLLNRGQSEPNDLLLVIGPKLPQDWTKPDC